MSKNDAPPPRVRRRMDPDDRRAQLLDAAVDYITAHGTAFSLHAIARQAGVSPPLMRHYFKTRDGLLAALFADGTREVVGFFSDPHGGDLRERLARYLDYVAAYPWSMRVWMAATDNEVAVRGAVAAARRQLVELSAGAPWAALDAAQRLRAQAWVASVESLVATWLDDGARERDALVETLLDIAGRLDVAGTVRVPA
jgi:AcrR family transcriptional regulator